MQRLVGCLIVAVCCLAGDRAGAQEATVEALTAKIADADPEVALAALHELRHLGVKAKPAVPALIGGLKSPDVRVQAGAASVLATIGPGASDAVDALIASLSGESAEVRAYAAHALGAIGKPAEPAAEALVKVVFDPEPMVRRAAMSALRNIGAPSEVLFQVFEDILSAGDVAVILPALQSIAEQAQEGVPLLREFLKKEKIAYWAAVLAADVGPKAADAVPELIALLEHGDPEVRLQTLIALGEIGPQSAAAVPKIVEILGNGQEIGGVQYAAAFALGKIEQKDEEVNRALVAAARGEEPILRMLSLWALARINPDQESVVRYAAETLVAGLTSENPQVRSAAARVLADFEGHTDIVGPALVRCLNDANPQVVGNALDALASLGPKVLDKLASALEKKELRHYASRVLYRMGPQAAPSVPNMVEALKAEPLTEDDRLFRVELQLALAAIGPEAALAVPELIKSLASEDHDVRGTASYALGRIGSGATAAIPVLQQRVAELEPGETLPLLWALLKIQPGNRELAEMAAPLLLSALDSDEPLVRAEAASALGQLGELGRPAVQRLRQLMDDSDPQVRQAVEEALQQLDN